MWLRRPWRRCLRILPSDLEVSLLKDMCEMYSPSGSEGDIARYITGVMRSHGWSAYIDSVGNAIGELGQGDRTIVLLGHMDTVPGRIPVRIEDGVLYGRGSVDAKGSLATFISAAARLPAGAGKRLVIIGAVEEETDGSRGAKHVVQGLSPSYCIIGEPSGCHSITLGYKGRLSAVVSTRRPAAHSASEGASAAEHGISLWRRVDGYCREVSAGRGPFERLDARLSDIRTNSDGLEERCDMRIVFRLPSGVDPTGFESTLRSLFPDEWVTVSGGQPAYRAGKNNLLVRVFIEAIRREGGVPRFKLKTGTSDMNVAGPGWGCPMLAYGPGDSSLDHTPAERVPLAEYGACINILARVLESL